MMTKDQIAKLQNIMRIAENGGNNTIIDLCKEIVYIDMVNEKKKESKFNIYDYISKDVNLRPAMASVHYENGEMVASDMHLLVVLKNQEYEERFEGKNVMKDGQIAEQRYPDYNSIHPQKNTKRIKIDFDKFDEILKEDKAKVKLMDKHGKKSYRATIKVGVTIFFVDLFSKLVNFMKHIGVDDVCFPENEKDAMRRTALVENENGWGLLMPVVVSTDADYSATYEL